MLKNCGEALGLLGCVLKRLKILMKFNRAGPVSKNGKINFDRPPFPELEKCPTCLKIAWEALGLLGCVLKRFEILMKFNSAGPVSKNLQTF